MNCDFELVSGSVIVILKLSVDDGTVTLNSSPVV